MVTSATFKKGDKKGKFKAGFDGCQKKMESQGKSPESAKKICGKINMNRKGGPKFGKK
jgi:hypothetical protein